MSAVHDTDLSSACFCMSFVVMAWAAWSTEKSAGWLGAVTDRGKMVGGARARCMWMSSSGSDETKGGRPVSS